MKIQMQGILKQNTSKNWSMANAFAQRIRMRIEQYELHENDEYDHDQQLGSKRVTIEFGKSMGVMSFSKSDIVRTR